MVRKHCSAGHSDDRLRTHGAEATPVLPILMLPYAPTVRKQLQVNRQSLGGSYPMGPFIMAKSCDPIQNQRLLDLQHVFHPTDHVLVVARSDAVGVLHRLHLPTVH
jgi:hypothetical protein